MTEMIGTTGFTLAASSEMLYLVSPNCGIRRFITRSFFIKCVRAWGQ